MFSRTRLLEKAIASSAPSAILPAFLLPAFPLASRSFSSSASRSSHIGGAALSIPPDVNFTIVQPSSRNNAYSQNPVGPTIHVEGPLGKLSYTIPPYVTIEHDTATRKATVVIEDRLVKKQREMWGTTRAYLQNHILGVSEGHTAILRLVGVGYRATVESTVVTEDLYPEFEGQKFINLKVGYSHPIEIPIPKGVTASVPQPTRILLEGPEKEVVMSLAAKIKLWRRPEPYKGKGIFVNGETIKLKAKKIK